MSRAALSDGPVEAEEAGRYWLRRHVFSCDAGRYRVFLDLARDRYFSIALERVPCAVKSLAAKRLITSNADERDESAPVAIERPTQSLLSDSLPCRSAGALRVMPAFFAACVRAHLSLRFGTMLAMVDNVARRKRARRAEAFDFERAAGVVERFEAVRPWFPRDYLCLFDSLALLDCLAWEGLYPSWVFGVYPEPFEAHCWVQEGPVVLNDRVTQVSAFTPIMVV